MTASKRHLLGHAIVNVWQVKQFLLHYGLLVVKQSFLQLFLSLVDALANCGEEVGDHDA